MIGLSDKESVVAKDKKRWLSKPQPHDYTAAADYLSLIFRAETVEAVVAALRDAAIVQRQAKDLLRASHLPLLPRKDSEVAKDLDKVKGGEKLSPILVVRGDGASNRPLIIADGYHRICASYHLDEDAEIPCQIAGLPASEV
ncbi:MAG: hypothetical protein JO265_08755 [Acidimicrobiia bacterium]|nr:hypothetical protein [Acidimicrobiia bacterium]